MLREDAVELVNSLEQLVIAIVRNHEDINSGSQLTLFQLKDDFQQLLERHL